MHTTAKCSSNREILALDGFECYESRLEDQGRIRALVERGHRSNAVRTDEYGDCTMCSETPSDPMGCNKCKQHLGCKVCVLKWYLISWEEGCHSACPLCRHRWATKPLCVSMSRIRIRSETGVSRCRGRGRGRRRVRHRRGATA